MHVSFSTGLRYSVDWMEMESLCCRVLCYIKILIVDKLLGVPETTLSNTEAQAVAMPWCRVGGRTSLPAFFSSLMGAFRRVEPKQTDD